MPTTIKKAKAQLGITDDISGIYKLSETEKAKLRTSYDELAITSAKGKNSSEIQEIETSHDFMMSYLNLPNDLFAKLKSGEALLDNEFVREAIINDTELLQQVLTDQTFIPEKLQSKVQFDLVSDSENYRKISERDLLLETIAQGIIKQQDKNEFMSKLPEILQNGPIKMTDLVSLTPELKDAIMKNIDAFPNAVQDDLREQLKKNEAMEQFNNFVVNVKDKFPQEIFAKAMENPEQARRLLANKDAQEKLDPPTVRAILNYPPNKDLYALTHHKTQGTLATFLASQSAQDAQKLLKDPNTKPYILVSTVVESLIEKGDVGDIVEIIQSDPNNNIVALAQEHQMIATAFATKPQFSSKLNNDEKAAIEEIHRNNLAKDYLRSHPEELKKLGLDDDCIATKIVKAPSGDYKLQFNRVKQNINGEYVNDGNLEEIFIKKDDVARLAQLPSTPQNQQTTTLENIAERAKSNVKDAITLFQNNDSLNQLPESSITQIMDAHIANKEFRAAVWENLNLLHAESRNTSPNGEDLNTDKNLVERWQQFLDITNKSSHEGKNLDLIALDNYRQINDEIFERVAKSQIKKTETETAQSQTNTPDPTTHQQQTSHERTATIPLDPPKPTNNDAVKNISEMMRKIFSAIDPEHKTYKAQLDSSLTAMVLKDEKPMLSVKPEKISLMEPFGKPPGSDADVAKVEMLAKAGNAAFGKAIIYSTNPAHKEFLQKQCDQLGVKFASTPEELAKFKAERAASLGTTISSMDTTQPKQTFGGVDPIAQLVMSTSTLNTTKPLPPTPPNPKTEFQQAIDALQSEDEKVRNAYLQKLLNGGGNQFFEVKPKDLGGAEISIKATTTLSNDHKKTLANAFASAVDKALPLAGLELDQKEMKITFNADYLKSLKTLEGATHTSTQSTTDKPKKQDPLEVPAQESLTALKR